MTTPTQSPQVSISPPKRTIVYIDGFNLYFGLLKYSEHKWLDLQWLFLRLRPQENITAIYYFTALVAGPTQCNQLAYWQALRTTPLVRIVEGNFKKKSAECHHPNCPGVGRKFFKTYEEKRTDVNIAVQMIDDAYQGMCDHIVLVSGDSDLVPPLDLVARRFPHLKITVYIPAAKVAGKPPRDRAYKAQLRSLATVVRLLPEPMLRLAQFPDPVRPPTGNPVPKPLSWTGVAKPASPPTPQCPSGACTWCHQILR